MKKILIVLIILISSNSFSQAEKSSKTIKDVILESRENYLKKIQKKQKNEDSQAQHELGAKYLYGVACEKNLEKAFFGIRKVLSRVI